MATMTGRRGVSRALSVIIALALMVALLLSPFPISVTIVLADTSTFQPDSAGFDNRLVSGTDADGNFGTSDRVEAGGATAGTSIRLSRLDSEGSSKPSAATTSVVPLHL